MPKNEKILGKYSNQKNRDNSIHVYNLAEELDPEICLDLDIGYVDDEILKDLTTLHVLASTATVNGPLSFGATIDPTVSAPRFIFGDTFGNEGVGTIDLTSDPIKLNLEIKDVMDDRTLPYYKSYELYKVKTSS